MMSKKTQVKADFKPSRIRKGYLYPSSFLFRILPHSFRVLYLLLQSHGFSQGDRLELQGRVFITQIPRAHPSPRGESPLPGQSCKSKSPGGSRVRPDPAHWGLQGVHANLEVRGRSSDLGVKN